MNRNCRVPGCWLPAASSYAAYCRAHRANLRRHGAVDQRGITKAELQPYVKLVRKRLAKNPSSPAWETLEARWETLVAHARRVVAANLSGRAGIRHERLAATEIVKLADTVSFQEVLEVTAAMVMMWEMEPRRFKGDQAMWIQLARRARGLSDMSYGLRYVHATGKMKRCYRDLTPKASIVLGKWLAEALGISGVHFARLERADADSQVKERQALHSALQNLA